MKKINIKSFLLTLLIVGLLFSAGYEFKKPYNVLSAQDNGSNTTVNYYRWNTIPQRCLRARGSYYNNTWHVFLNFSNPVIDIRQWQELPKPEQPEVEQPTPEQPAPEQPEVEQTKPEPEPEPTKPVTPEPESPQTEQVGLSYEQSRMLELVNEERVKAGAKPLVFDTELANVAYAKAKDMVDNNYFSHDSPTYGSPFTMMKNFGIRYSAAGENLAGYNNVDKAHVGLMNSEGHRNNILNSNFTHIGIGVHKSPKYGYVFVQMFIRK